MSKFASIVLVLNAFAALGQQKQAMITNAECISSLVKNDVPLNIPRPGEWLYLHKEHGQSFDEYSQSKPVMPTASRNRIYLLPIGKFTPIQWCVVEYTADYLRLFFERQVSVLKATEATMVPDSLRRYSHTDHEQLQTTPILNYLEKAIPKDGLIMIAITAKDLYPSDSYNYVFGMARTKQRVGVSSIFRFSDATLDSINYQKCLERLIKTCSHEMVHMLSMKHCIAAVCLMNGSNSLSESDKRPNRLCSSCLQKLQWNLRFNVRSRLEKISAYFAKHRFENDLLFALSDKRLLKL